MAVKEITELTMEQYDAVFDYWKVTFKVTGYSGKFEYKSGDMLLLYDGKRLLYAFELKGCRKERGYKRMIRKIMPRIERKMKKWQVVQCGI